LVIQINIVNPIYQFCYDTKLINILCNISILKLILIMSLGRVGVMVFNATFNNISVISWWSVLLMEDIGVPGENHRPAASH
jgi:hypothetical protein